MAKKHFKRYFTLAQANTLLPRVKRILVRIQRKQEVLIQEFPELAEIRKGNLREAGFANSTLYLHKTEEVNQLVDHLTGYGLVLRDLNKGLVDFPHLSEGKEVFLCWEQGEKEILYWHDLDTGYAGRQPLYLDQK